MNYHLILIRLCNLNCQYCHGGEETGAKAELQYSLDELEDFLDFLIAYENGEEEKSFRLRNAVTGSINYVTGGLLDCLL